MAEPVRRSIVDVTSPKSRVRAWEARPGFVLQVIEGRPTIESAHEVIALRDAVIARVGKIVIGIDATGVRGYEPGVRELYGQWTRLRREQIVSQHVLLSSNLMRMAIELTNLASGREVLTPHTERSEFERALRKLVPEIDFGASYAAI